MADISKIKTLDGTTYDIKDAAAYRKPSGGIPSTDMTSAVQSSLTLADSAVQPSLVSNEYDSTASYNVGDYCIYEGDLYKCNTAIATGGETWTAAHWTATNVDGELKACSFYGTCNTAAATVQKNVVLPGFTDDMLKQGTTVRIYFYYSNTAQSPKLKVGDSTAKFIAQPAVGTPIWNNSTTMTFTYDGSEWVVNDGFIPSFTMDGVKPSTTTNTITRLGKCVTASDVATKSVSNILSGSMYASSGTRITVWFKYPNTAENPTLAIYNYSSIYIHYNGNRLTGSDVGLLSGYVDLVLDSDSYGNLSWNIVSGASSSSSSSSLPVGGTAGDFMIKNSSTDFDADWTDTISGFQMVNSVDKVLKLHFTHAGVNTTDPGNDDNLDFGWDWSTVSGAGMALRSSGDAVGRQGGVFVLYARNGVPSDEDTSQLYGYPDGRLYWNIKSANHLIVRTVDETNQEIGDVATVTAVDANGNPTEWKNRPAVLKFTKSNLSSLPYTFTDSDTNSPIDSKLEVVNYVLSNPSAQVDNWTITTADDHSITISGTINGTTNVTLYFSTPSRSLVD